MRIVIEGTQNRNSAAWRALTPPLSISYMGTKRQLAGTVASVIHKSPNGPFLDLFAGMCAIGRAIAPARSIWTNDFLRLPEVVAKCLFTHIRPPRPAEALMTTLESAYKRNRSALSKQWAEALRREQQFLASPTIGRARLACDNLPFAGNSAALEKRRSQYHSGARSFPYCQATLLYAGSYFSLRQCIEIDSALFAIDTCATSECVSLAERDWLRAGLCAALSRVNNSTGQFAQYLRPSSSNIARIVRQQRRSVWTEFWKSLEHARPIGTSRWRRDNDVFRRDATELLIELRARKLAPAVIYADPPYSLAQYSRYYHVLESLLEYRYPEIRGVGRYCEDRPHTKFSCSAQVVGAMDSLARAAAECAPTLILSYPNRGLLQQVGEDPHQILKTHFRTVRRVKSLAHTHSSFGAQPDAPKINAVEHIYVATA